MYTRLLSTPTRSIFLFGPRGAGKSTWIRDRFPDTVTYDLLDTGEALRLTKDPHALYRELATLPRGSWVVIDEVQKRRHHDGISVSTAACIGSGTSSGRTARHVMACTSGSGRRCGTMFT